MERLAKVKEDRLVNVMKMSALRSQENADGIRGQWRTLVMRRKIVSY